MAKIRRMRGYNGKIFFNLGSAIQNLELISGSIGGENVSDIEGYNRNILPKIEDAIERLTVGKTFTNQIGEIDELSISIDQGVDGYRELGSRTQKIREGPLEVSGSISHGFISIDLLRLAAGAIRQLSGVDIDLTYAFAASKADSEAQRLSKLVPLKFHIEFQLDPNPKIERNPLLKARLENVMLSTWGLTISATDFILESCDFVAEDLVIVDWRDEN